jgi:hypothetical protein
LALQNKSAEHAGATAAAAVRVAGGSDTLAAAMAGAVAARATVRTGGSAVQVARPSHSKSTAKQTLTSYPACRCTQAAAAIDAVVAAGGRNADALAAAEAAYEMAVAASNQRGEYGGGEEEDEDEAIVDGWSSRAGIQGDADGDVQVLSLPRACTIW